MESSKRPWKRSEKLLFLAPLLLLGFAAFIYQWRGAQPVEIAITGVPMDWKFSPDGRFIAVEHQIKFVNYLSVYDAKTGALKVDLSVPKLAISKGYAEPLLFSWASDSKSLAAGYFDLQTGTRSFLSNGKKRTNFIPKLVVWNFPSGSMRGYWPAAKSSEFASVPDPRFADKDTKIWSESTPPSLFDATNGKRLRSFGIMDNENDWHIESAAQKELVKTRSKVVESFEFPLNADVKVEYKNASNIKVGQLDRRSLILRNVQTSQIYPTPTQSYSEEGKLAHSSRKVALLDMNRRLETEHGGGKIESSRLIIWDFAEGKEQWRTQSLYIPSVSWSPDDRLIAFVESGDFNKYSLQIADAQNGQILWESNIVEGNTRLVWSPSGDRIALKVNQKLKIVSMPKGLVEETP